MTVAYGINLNDWTHIPGGGVSGPSLIRPDFPELKEPFPFLWQQAEYVLTGAATYVFTVLAADSLLNPEEVGDLGIRTVLCPRFKRARAPCASRRWRRRGRPGP